MHILFTMGKKKKKNTSENRFAEQDRPFSCLFIESQVSCEMLYAKEGSG